MTRKLLELCLQGLGPRTVLDNTITRPEYYYNKDLLTSVLQYIFQGLAVVFHAP